MKISRPIPHLVVNDGQVAVAFYEKAFGAVLEERHLAEDGKRLMHAHLSIGERALYLHDEFPEYGDHGAKAPTQHGGASCVIHLDGEDADSTWQQAMEAGAASAMALDRQFWGMRYGQLRDPFGHVWSIGAPVK